MSMGNAPSLLQPLLALPRTVSLDDENDDYGALAQSNQVHSNEDSDEITPKVAKRHIGLVDGVALILGLQIGSGIFISPSLIARNAGSEPAALLIWCLAGLLAWACAACYIELGVRMPVNGGPQEYLAYCFNDLTGFLASWACIFTVKPCSAAILALVISDYVCDAFDLGTGHFGFARKVLGLLVIALVATLNSFGNRFSNLATKLMLACKIFGVGFVIVVGFGTLIFGQRPSPSIGPNTEPALPHTSLSNYTDATLSAMWAYSGWETLAFVGGELKDPARNTSLVINMSMTVVILLSVLANIAYFSALTFQEIISSTTIGLTFCQHFLGRASGVVYAIVICLSTLGALNIKVFTGARLTQAAAEREFLPIIIQTVRRGTAEERAELIHEESSLQKRVLTFFQSPTQYGDGSVPFAAIIFNGMLASVYVLLGDFGSLIIFIGIAEYTVAFFTLLGLLSLRLRPESFEGNAIDPVTFHVPSTLIILASAATAVMVSVSAGRHPVAGFGFVAFCVVTSCVYTKIIKEKEA